MFLSYPLILLILPLGAGELLGAWLSGGVHALGPTAPVATELPGAGPVGLTKCCGWPRGPCTTGGGGGGCKDHQAS